MVRRSPAFACLLVLAGCSLTPIPDVTSDWSPPCDAPLRRCAQEFRLAAGTEKTVELRGDFRADGWTRGEPMQREGDAWVVRVTVPWGSAVQYKFVVDGTWILDPANPATGTTGGVTNSLLTNVTCAKWTCSSTSG